MGDKPYENGYWGTDVARDFVCVELYDDIGNLIEYKNLSLADSLVIIDEDYVQLKPGLHLQAFGFKRGKFKIRYKFLRNLGGSDSPVLIRTREGFEGEVYQVNDDASNIFVRNDGKIFAGTEESYLNGSDSSGLPLEQLTLTSYKYDVDKISSSRTEVRLKAKNIRTNQIGIPETATTDPNGLAAQYIDDFKPRRCKSKNIENVSAVFMGDEADMTGQILWTKLLQFMTLQIR